MDGINNGNSAPLIDLSSTMENRVKSAREEEREKKIATSQLMGVIPQKLMAFLETIGQELAAMGSRLEPPSFGKPATTTETKDEGEKQVDGKKETEGKEKENEGTTLEVGTDPAQAEAAEETTEGTEEPEEEEPKLKHSEEALDRMNTTERPPMAD